jgi:hypothetical protein
MLTETGTSPQLGDVSVIPVLDVEFPSTSPHCAAAVSFTETLDVAEASTLSVRIHGPYLCSDVVGTTQRTYAIVSGTGRLSGASGSGSIAFDVSGCCATETWQGTLTAAGSPAP